MINPKYEKHLKDRGHEAMLQRPMGRYGIISSYDPTDNTATVIISSQDSDGISEQPLRKVPCPLYPGVQGAAPGPGTPCFVQFLSSRNESRPIITNYFNHEFRKRDYYRHTDARHGVSQFYLNM